MPQLSGTMATMGAVGETVNHMCVFFVITHLSCCLPGWHLELTTSVSQIVLYVCHAYSPEPSKYVHIVVSDDFVWTERGTFSLFLSRCWFASTSVPFTLLRAAFEAGWILRRGFPRAVYYTGARAVAATSPRQRVGWLASWSLATCWRSACGP